MRCTYLLKFTQSEKMVAYLLFRFHIIDCNRGRTRSKIPAGSGVIRRSREGKDWVIWTHVGKLSTTFSVRLVAASRRRCTPSNLFLFSIRSVLFPLDRRGEDVTLESIVVCPYGRSESLGSGFYHPHIFLLFISWFRLFHPPLLSSSSLLFYIIL